MGIKLAIKHFKSLWNVEFEPGKVNVLIGANGSGKSALLEAIGVLSAAIAEKVDQASLQHRGVRLGVPALYKSSFISKVKLPHTIDFTVEWPDDQGDWLYNVHLNNPIKNPNPEWEYHSEKLVLNNTNIFFRLRETGGKVGELKISLDKYKGWLSFLQGVQINGVEDSYASDLYKLFKDYAIYTPNTPTLRGIQQDMTQREPIGLFGGRLPEAFTDLLAQSTQYDNYDLLEMLDWVSEVNTGKASKEILPTSVSTPGKIFRFKDKFMREGRNELTAYDASEGSLFVIFLMTLAMHPQSPKMFAIDNFDQALNPRLARTVMERFAEWIIEQDKTVFLTTHNPLVLDGLDLQNDDIRLFTVGRNKGGETVLKRIMVDENMIEASRQGIGLSRLWITGRLGGVPNI